MYLRHYGRFVYAVSAVLALLILIGSFYGEEGYTTATLAGIHHTLVIDPGHGGIDSGAVSADGKKESDINLAISDKMAGICDFFGVKYVMTREGDVDNSSGDYSERENLLARAELANKTDTAVLISVHQNSYPGENVRGAEVLYADTNGSETLAKLTQAALVTYLDPQNRRLHRPAPEELLLTSGVNCPAILVECGFLSDPQEADKLSDDTYQTKTAMLLTASFIIFDTAEHPA